MYGIGKGVYDTKTMEVVVSPKTPPGQTRKQIFKFIEEQLAGGHPPSIREVQKAFHFRSAQTAREHMDALAAEGLLVKLPGISRGYRLPEAQNKKDLYSIPLLGRVQAGHPTVPVEEIEDYLPMKAQREDKLFALRVRGDSMKNAGIFHGDVVIVRHQPVASDGDIVVALIGDEATVKRLKIGAGRIELHPENPDFEPIVALDISIIGKVVEVRRVLD